MRTLAGRMQTCSHMCDELLGGQSGNQQGRSDSLLEGNSNCGRISGYKFCFTHLIIKLKAFYFAKTQARGRERGSRAKERAKS